MLLHVCMMLLDMAGCYYHFQTNKLFQEYAGTDCSMINIWWTENKFLNVCTHTGHLMRDICVYTAGMCETNAERAIIVAVQWLYTRIHFSVLPAYHVWIHISSIWSQVLTVCSLRNSVFSIINRNVSFLNWMLQGKWISLLPFSPIFFF